MSGCAAPPHEDVGGSHVEWRRVEQLTDRPLAVFVDQPGGRLDLLARDPDVTTFLNDRFHPLLLPQFGAQPHGTVGVYTADGCELVEAFSPSTPGEFIAQANIAIQMPGASGRTAVSAQVRECP
ncbi:MAG: hypothetical protein EXR69_05010 [Myxococcales bacterium]|nr:hypothetical protein [Myxococcales bacterium]